MSLDADRKSRKLTRFLCQELLYDYSAGRLDYQRRRDVEEFMAGCRETQKEFELLQRGIKSAQLASRVQVSVGLHEALKNFEPQWRKSLSAWTLWSSQRGWKVLPYVFVGVALALVLVIKKPWQPSGSKDLILAEMTDEAVDAIPESTPSPEPTAATVPVIAAGPGVPPNISVPATDLPPIQSAQVEKDQKTAEAAAEDRPQQSEPATLNKGFIMRGEIDVSDFENTWPLVRDKIIALGGKAAGSVELGWLRKNDESYFHLTMPESNYNELELFLGTFGPVRFSKERHPRVMLSGQIRIILTVKDGGPTNKSPAETP